MRLFTFPGFACKKNKKKLRLWHLLHLSLLFFLSFSFIPLFYIFDYLPVALFYNILGKIIINPWKAKRQMIYIHTYIRAYIQESFKFRVFERLLNLTTSSDRLFLSSHFWHVHDGLTNITVLKGLRQKSELAIQIHLTRRYMALFHWRSG